LHLVQSTLKRDVRGRPYIKEVSCFLKKISTLCATVALSALLSGQLQAETLRLLTWGGYAPDNVIELFEKQYPDIKVEVTLSNNEEMIAKLRATGGAGFDLAQPSHDRILTAQEKYDIYKPLDLGQINTDVMQENLLEAVKGNATIDDNDNDNVYAVPHLWGTTGLVVDKTKAPDVKDWLDLCNPQYAGKTSIRLRRTILLAMGFSLGYDPFALYADKQAYEEMPDKVADTMIACKNNVKAYWVGGDDFSAMLLSGEVVASESWDATAFKIYDQNKNIVYVAPHSNLC